MRKALVKVFEIYEQEVVVTITGDNEKLPIEVSARIAIEEDHYVYNGDARYINRLPLDTAQFVEEIKNEPQETPL